jgi:hypothetical protein
MPNASTRRASSTKSEREQMHALYRQGGREHAMAPHIVYADAACPHAGCGLHTQAIHFRVEAYGPAVHDPLVRAWWDDRGFAGRCPKCRGWIHFTIGSKRAISDAEATRLLALPDDWHANAVIL